MNLPVLDIRTDGSFAIPAIGYRNTVVLVGGAAQQIPVPIDPATGKCARYAIFCQTNEDFIAAYNAAAIIPTGPITNGSGPDINPSSRTLDNVNYISVIASAAVTISVDFFR